MAYTVLNIEQDAQAQGFEPHSYDLVIASLVIHATRNLEQTLRNARSLLKPGGYLLMSELTNIDITRASFIFGCLPGWWLGKDEGRVLHPSVSPSKWDAVLRRSGFSGIDSMTPEHDDLPFASSVMVSRAVGGWADFILEPLSASPTLFPGQVAIKQLFIVGGTTTRVGRLSREIQKLVRGFCGSISLVETLEELDHIQLKSNITMLILADLDRPVFKDLNPARFQSLKQMFSSEKTIIWVTENRRVDNPYSSMIIGFARSALWEVPDLRFQHLDLENISKPDARVLVESLIRFHMSGRWSGEQDQESPLWSIELETIIDSSGRQLVPRMEALHDANDRFNSARREITKKVHPQGSAMVVSRAKEHWVVHEQSPGYVRSAIEYNDSTVALTLTHSILRAVKSPIGHMFVALGKSTSDDKQYVAISGSAASLLRLPKSHVIAVLVPPGSEALFIALMAVHLLVATVISAITQAETLLLHNAPPIVMAALTRQIHTTAIHVVYTTSSREEAARSHCTYVNPYSRQAQLRSLIPTNVTRCTDFTHLDQSSNQPSPIAACLPPDCNYQNVLSLFLETSREDRFQKSDKVAKVLKEALDLTILDFDSWQQQHAPNICQLSLAEISNKSNPWDLFTVVDWTAQLPVSISVRQRNAELNPERTYWLIGLSRDLGLSLCDWMISRGAKHVVITSRNPKIDPAWLEESKHKGALVQVFSW